MCHTSLRQAGAATRAAAGASLAQGHGLQRGGQARATFRAAGGLRHRSGLPVKAILKEGEKVEECATRDDEACVDYSVCPSRTSERA